MGSKKSQGAAASAPLPSGWETSQPDIRVAYAPAGRETLEAIAAEIGATNERPNSIPDIQVREAPAGRETLAAIADELRPGGRGPLDTLPYADRIKNAPGSHSPSSVPAVARRTSETLPEISVGEAPAGRETLAAIEQDALAGEVQGEGSDGDRAPNSGFSKIVAGRMPAAPASAPSAAPAPEALEIFEMATFVVRGPDAARLSTDALRRRFVEEHLMHRLPVDSLDEIDRVDVTPWTVRGTFVVRVWCKVAAIDRVDVVAD